MDKIQNASFYHQCDHDISDFGSWFAPVQNPIWDRERGNGWSPAQSLLSTIRRYQFLLTKCGPFALFVRRTLVIRHIFWSIVTGADIPLNSKIGGGLLLPHPNGIVIHPEAEIGTNCLLFQQVTIGATKAGVPRVGNNVDVGAGAKIIGPIVVGDYVQIGANAVVTHDIPPGCVVVGVPARVINRISPPVNPNTNS